MKPLLGRSLGVMLWLVLAASIGALGSSGGLAQPVKQALPAASSFQVAPAPLASEEPYPPPRAEFTRAEYEAALAKWRSQRTTRYEMLIHQGAFRYPEGSWRLTVQVDGVREVVTAFESVGLYEVPVTDIRDLDELTIASLFTFIDQALQEVEKAGGVGHRSITPYVYEATFHPELGYPVSYSGEPSVPYPDASFSIKVESVTIQQRDVLPGMPRTGHPGA